MQIQLNTGGYKNQQIRDPGIEDYRAKASYARLDWDIRSNMAKLGIGVIEETTKLWRCFQWWILFS